MKVYRDITDNNGVVTSTIEIFDIMEGTYSGTDMGERSITATIEYETPIDFKAGDYVEFNIADLVRQSNVEGGNIYERFYLYTMPTIEKTSSPFSAKDAFKHTLTFYPRQYELGCTMMRDLIQDNGNNVLYTGWDEFSFYGGAKMLMDRIIAVLHERFGTKGVAGIDYWDYKIADEVNEEKNTALEKFQFDFSANSVMDALLKLNEEEGINTKFFINSRMIYVGYKRPYIVGVDDNNIIKTIPFNFQYGKTSHLPLSVNNGGLYSITKSTGQATPITRLYAYGSDKNLHRFYCSDRIKSGRYVNRLMLPSFGDDGVTDYIESEEGIAKFGIREGSKTFDEIYPSLRYFTYGDLREIKYVIKLMGCGIESDDDNVYDAAQEHKYPIARVQCYKVVEGSNGVNTLVKSAPPVDLAVFLHATGKVVKCTLYANKDGKSSIQRQIAADGTWGNGNGRIPANSLQGSDYIVGSCFAIHDSGYADNNTTITSRNDWFRNTDTIKGSNGDGELTEEQKKLVNEIEIHQINYTDTSWITDIYEFEEYEQTHFSRHGYSAYCYPRINKNYPNSQSDSIDVNEVVEVGSVLIEDTELNISEGKNQSTYEIYLKDIGFKINEQNWFGEYVFLIDTVKVNFLDGNLGGYSFDVLKETDASELAENIVPAHLPNGEKNPAFFDNAQDTVQATRAYEKGAFWRIVLKRCDTEINNYWLPNTMLNANAGDRIVLLDIYMPDIYQRAAENRLLREATKYLDANDDGDIQYTFTFDKIRLQQIPALARQLREGAIMRIVDNDLQIKTENKTKTIRNNDVPVVYTKSLTYSDVNSSVVEENTYVANRDVEYLKGKGIEKVEITADIKVHHEGESGGHGGQGEVVWTFKSGEFNLVISDEDTKNTLQTIGDNKIKVTLYSESKNAYFERVCTIKEKIDSKTYKLVLGEDSFEKSEYTGLGTVYVMYSVLIKDSSINVDVTKKILPYGTNVFCEAIDLIDFQAGKYYEVTIDVEDNGLAAVDSGSQNTLFALVNGLGDGQRWFIPNYTFERVDETKHPFRGFATYDRYTFKFTLGEDFNDNSSYYTAIRYISNGETEKVSVRLVSIIERDSDSLIDMNYVDLGIETLSINFHDNTRVKPSIPMSYEITATVKEETRASAWVQVMQRIDSTEIVGEQTIKTQETLANMARRHYRELLALKGSIFDPDGTCDQTFLQVMMMQVGADSMNYQLDNTRTGLNKDGLQTLFNCLCANNKFEVGASDRLRHYVYTQGSQGGTWEIAGGVSFALDGMNTYFVAIKCERDGRNGVWVCDTNQHKVDEEENYWYFNWAIINIVGGEYVLTETRGNAYMYGDNLVCGKISTLAGQSYFDLTHGNFVLSDGISIKPSLSYIDGVLTISGVNSEDADSILSRLGITEGVATGAQASADAANAAAEAAQAAAEEASKAAQAAKEAGEAAGQAAKEYAKGLADALGDSLQNQIDGVIDSYFMEGVPYGNFRPSSDWSTTEVKNRHLGDTYTNILKNKGNLSELDSNGNPMWIEQGYLTVGTQNNGKTFEEQRKNASNFCRTKTIFENYTGLTISAAPAGIDKLVILYDANKQYVSNLAWETGAQTLNNAGTYPYISIIFRKTNGTNITPSDLAGITSSALTNPEAGKSWRWCNNDDTDDSTFHWHEIADSDAVLALQKAAEAQDTADEKRRVFVSQPIPPYEVGDLWAQGGNSGEDILKCTTARATGSFQQSDWAAASSALSAAADAQQAADNAQADATSSLTQLGNMSSDSMITPQEKVSIRTEWASIQQEYAKNIAKANDLSLTYTTYTNAYNALNTYLTNTIQLSNSTTTVTVTKSEFNSKFSTYYAENVNILNAIAKALAQAAADSVQVGGANLLKNSNFKTNNLDGFSIYDSTEINADKAYTLSYDTTNECLKVVTTKAYTSLNDSGYRLFFNALSRSVSTWSGIKAGENYMLSFDVWASKATDMRCYIGYGTSTTKQIGTAKTRFVAPIQHSYTGDTYYNNIFFLVKDICTFYIDNVKLEKGNKATDWIPAPEDVDEEIADAKTAANNAQTAVNNVTNDGIISGGTEKANLKREWQAIAGENLLGNTDGSYFKALSQANKYIVDATSMQNYFAALKNAMDFILQITNADTSISAGIPTSASSSIKTRDNFNLLWKNYYDAEIVVLNAVSDKIKSAADAAQATADAANDAAASAQSAVSALDYLKAALTDGSTEIAGGLTMTNVLMLKNLQGAVTAGMSGLTKLPSDSSKSENVLMWGGGTYEDAYNAAESENYYKKDSTTPITTLLKKDGTGKIGVFKISDTQAIIDVPNQGKVVIDASSSNGGIFIYDNKNKQKVVLSPKTISNSGYMPPSAVSWEQTSASVSDKTVTQGYYQYGTYKTINLGSTKTFSTTGTIQGFSVNLNFSNIKCYVQNNPTTSVTYFTLRFAVKLISSGGTEYYTSGYSTIENVTSGYRTLTIDTTYLPAGTYKISLYIAHMGNYSSGTHACSFSVSYSWSSIFAPTYESKTVICADGIISAYDIEKYFMVQNTDNGQKIYAKGLSTTKGTSGSGELYVSSSFIDSFKDFINYFKNEWVPDVRSIGSNKDKADNMISKANEVLTKISETSLLANS